ncbi:DNA (cytosine-5)-methyltransferase 1 [Methanococcus maripaludis]|uniref:DNA (cytosine-5-)-methyltransferase n=1 Tax=Methanococcus maripaludis TaxID=39152 RepID=A0A7J9S9A6_METMI|nr:DNA cytosine methyltransferase [Methanococcus maripaludis]MBB6402464.1 DNA (cytosine-5)-methyltransferase 1 [Methanococcus maripaludis]
MVNENQVSYIDLFAGCGGISLGLHNAGLNGLFAIEKNPTAFETLQYNLIDKRNHFDWPEWLPTTCYDINDILKEYRENLSSLKEVDLVVGGPPCQGFSMTGRRNESDIRNKLVSSYIKFIELVQPDTLFFENVRGFTVGFLKGKSRGEAYSEKIVKELTDHGYNVEAHVLDFSKYGVPQNRKRFILIGSKNNDPKKFFEQIEKKKSKFLKDKGIPKTNTIHDAISDLERKHGEINSPDTPGFKAGKYGVSTSKFQKLMRKNCDLEHPDSHRFANHRQNTIEKYEYILNKCESGKNIKKSVKESFGTKKRCMKLLDPNEPSPTLTTNPDDYVHYNEPRIMTVREFARIQTFDDSYEFKGKYTTGGKMRKLEVPRYTQIGNAIPPLFGELAGLVLNKF